MLENKSVLWYYKKEFVEIQLATMEVGNRGSIFVPVGVVSAASGVKK